MLLQLKNIAKFYGSRLIFKNVALQLDAGQTLLLAGPNGAGKSTLLRIMAGLARPNAGEVLYGKALLGAEAHIGYLGHQTFLYPALSALENLMFWNRMYGFRRSRADLQALLQRVDLARFAEEKAGNFSRGMAQRLNLARILLVSPLLLLLDEPTTGLDVRSRAMLDMEIKAAGQRGAGIVWISHSLDDDLPKADAVALLSAGKLSFCGSTGEYEKFIKQQAQTAVPDKAVQHV